MYFSAGGWRPLHNIRHRCLMSAKTRMPANEEARVPGTDIVGCRIADMPLRYVCATVKQAFNPFVLKCRVDFSADPGGRMLDCRLALASVVLLLAIEGRQQ